MKTWFTAKAYEVPSVYAGEPATKVAEISIYDEIGAWGITAKDFQRELKALGDVKDIRVSINSPGGEVFDGLAIHNMLRRHKARVTVTVDGVAASIASVIAMAGDEIRMPSNAMLMVHNPSGVVVGTSKDMRELADALDKIRNSLVAAYATKTSMSHDEIVEIMDAETWLSADEAVAMGFADVIDEPVRMAASFNLSKFKNAPAALADAVPRDSVALHPAEEVTLTNEANVEAADEAVETQATEELSTVANEAEAETVEETVEANAEPDVSGIVARARDEERARSADIVAACALVGRASAAAEYIAKGKSLSEVLNELRTTRAASSPDVSAHHHPAPRDTRADWSRVIERTNARVSG